MKKRILNLLKISAILSAFPLLTFICLTLIAVLYYQSRILPGVTIGGIEIGGLTTQQAKELLSVNVKDVYDDFFVFAQGKEYYQRTLAELGMEYDLDKTITQAKNIGRENFFSSIFFISKGALYQTRLVPSINFTEEKFQKLAEKLKTDIDQGVLSSYVDVQNEALVFVEGKDGHAIDEEALKLKLVDNLNKFQGGVIKIPIKFISKGIDSQDGQLAIEKAKSFLDKKIVITTQEKTWTLDGKKIVPMLAYYKNGDIVARFDEEKVTKFVASLSSEIDQETQEPRLTIENDKAKVFQPSQDGLALDKEKTKEELKRIGLSPQKEERLILSVNRTQARVKTEEVNNLGIKEIIGRGSSNFSGSSSERIFNIELASLRINGTLISPGEVFSFNKAVGDISAQTGYKTAYIIERGRTLFGAGGGVCQVSTTVFRAAIYSGLPLVQRNAHAYRVRYYEQASHPVGLDATIYQPTVDFKFRNDTPNWVLVTAKVERKSNTLTFELWGSKDGRLIEVSKPKLSAVSPPPEPLYEDDPSLPKGTTKQADFAAWGGLC